MEKEHFVDESGNSVKEEEEEEEPHGQIVSMWITKDTPVKVGNTIGIFLKNNGFTSRQFETDEESERVKGELCCSYAMHGDEVIAFSIEYLSRLEGLTYEVWRSSLEGQSACTCTWSCVWFPIRVLSENEEAKWKDIEKQIKKIDENEQERAILKREEY